MPALPGRSDPRASGSEAANQSDQQAGGLRVAARLENAVADRAAPERPALVKRLEPQAQALAERIASKKSKPPSRLFAELQERVPSGSRHAHLQFGGDGAEDARVDRQAFLPGAEPEQRPELRRLPAIHLEQAARRRVVHRPAALDVPPPFVVSQAHV